MLLKLKNPVKHNGEQYGVGAVIDIDNDSAGRLLVLGCAEKLQKKNGADTSEATEKKTALQETKPEVKEIDEALVSAISGIPGVSDQVAKSLIEAGYDSVSKVAKASKKDLVSINGIGKKSAVSIIEAAKEELRDDSDLPLEDLIG